jgi:hypothetical protein
VFRGIDGLTVLDKVLPFEMQVHKNPVRGVLARSRDPLVALEMVVYSVKK